MGWDHFQTVDFRMKARFRELHFTRRRTLRKIGEFYPSDHGRQPQFGQNSISARSKAKNKELENISFIFDMYVPNPFH